MLCSSANTAATKRIFSSMGQISRHGILHLLPWHLIRYPCCRSILLPMLPVCTFLIPPPRRAHMSVPVGAFFFFSRFGPLSPSDPPPRVLGGGGGGGSRKRRMSV